MWVAGYVAGEAFLRKYTFGEAEPAVRHEFGTTGARVRGVAVDAAGDVWVVGATSVNLSGTILGHHDVFVRKYPRNGSNPTTYQFGTESDDLANGAALDSEGNVWVVGTTQGALAGSNVGLDDAFLRKYPVDGSAPITYQFGTQQRDIATSVAVDLNGNIWVGGSTEGAFGGYQSQGETDAFVRMYPASGAAPSTYQFGTPGADSASALISDAVEGVWVLGYESESDADSPSDALVTRYIAGQQNVESYSIATPNGWDTISGGAVDAQGHLWVGGTVAGTLVGTSAGGSDAFVSQIAR